MLGAALYEKGQRDRAMPMIRDYYKNLEQGWTMGFMAVARYYLGLDALEKDDKETALNYLAGSPWVVAHPGFPQIRTCALERIRLVRAWVHYHW